MARSSPTSFASILAQLTPGVSTMCSISPRVVHGRGQALHLATVDFRHIWKDVRQDRGRGAKACLQIVLPRFQLAQAVRREQSEALILRLHQ